MTPNIQIVPQKEFNLGWAGDTNRLTGKIRISEDYLNTSEITCLIAHEYTHWLQWINGKLTLLTPSTEIEPQAYYVSLVCFEYYGNENQINWARNKVKICKEQSC